MPNGIDKNWYRMLAAINGFRSRYGSWPTKIHLPEIAIQDLFTEETYKKLEEKLEFISDGSTYIAENDTGKSYDYGLEGYFDKPPDIHARDWLKVEPDSEMVKAYYAPRNNGKEDRKEDRI